MAKQHDMDRLSLRHTTPPASLESQEERRDSMEDADCSPTRFKRPRLDSGSRAVRKMSADLDHADAERLAHTVGNAPATPTEPREQTDDSIARTPLTPSRVTINVRPQQTSPQNPTAAPSTPTARAHTDEAVERVDADSDSSSSATLRSSPSACSPKSKMHTPPADPERNDSALSPADASPVVEITVDDPQNEDDIQNNVIEIEGDDEEEEEEIMPVGNIFDAFPFADRFGRDTAVGGFLDIIGKPRQAHRLEGEFTKLKDWLKDVAARVTQGRLDPSRVYLEEPVFWDTIARIFQRILQRLAPYGEGFNLEPEQTEDDALQELWSAYATCVAQIMNVEIKYLKSHVQSFDNPSHIMSYMHVAGLEQLVRFQPELPFWALARDYLAADTVKMCSSVMSAFIAEFDSLPNLASFVRLGISNPSLRPLTMETLAFITHLSHFAAIWKEKVGRTECRWLSRHFSPLVKELDREIQESLKAPIEICSELVSATSALLHVAASMDKETSKQLATDIYGDYEGWGDICLMADVVCESWHLKTLRQYILKGNMAHRLYGVENMSQHFINIWTSWNQKTHEGGQEVLDLFSRFLLQDGIIDYIIGVDSHPQLVSRSGNIVGFLAVNRKYGQAQTDAIWNSITQNQDPRMVEALIEMFGHTAQLMELSELLYVCTKFRTLPVSSFTVSSLDLFRSICGQIHKKTRQRRDVWDQDENRVKVFDICVYLAQESFQAESSTLVQNLHQFVTNQLAGFAKTDLASDGDKERIYEACAQDIRDKTPHAAASAEIISVIAKTGANDALFLAENLNLPEDIAGELCAFVKAEKDSEHNPQLNALASRLDLMFHLMRTCPDFFSSATQEAVWDHLVGRDAIDNIARDIAWHNLSHMARSQLSENSFLERCATELLPKLEPEFYTPGLFDFLRSLTDYQRRTSKEEEISHDGIVQPPSVDLIWRVILTAPTGTIERTTAEYLASLYLDARIYNQYVADYPNVVQDTHVALVRHCMSQMVAAYSTLKTPMVDSASDEVEMKDASSSESARLLELQFQRTFLFLNVLLGVVRKRPDLQMTSPRLNKPPMQYVLPSTEGELCRVRFQPIGTEPEPIHSAIVGELETLSWLAEKLREWTGFAEFRLIHGGAPLDLEKLGDRTIRDLSLDQKGAILVKSTGDAAAASHAQGISSVIEKEILTNYDTMFDFMDGGDDSLSEAAYDFLCQLPPHGKALAVTFGGRETSSIADIAASAFPPGKLFKARTSVFTLKKDFKSQMRSVYSRKPSSVQGAAINVEQGPVNVQLISHSVQLLNAAILNEKLIDSNLSEAHDEFLAWLVLDTFTELLKERVEPEVSSSYFTDEVRLVDRLMSFLKASLSRATGSNITCLCYIALLEAFHHSRGVWEAFKGRDDLNELHFILLVSHPDERVRQTISLNIENNCRHISEKSYVGEDDIVSFYWKILSNLLPHGPAYAKSSKQLFELSVKTFRRYDELQRDEATLRAYITSWSDLMLAYKHEAFVGRANIDFAVFGFAQLLRTAVQSLKSFKKPLNIETLASKIFSKFLFPPTPAESEDNQRHESGSLPVLDTKTREELYDLITALCEDATVYKKMIDLNLQLLSSCAPATGPQYQLGGSRDLRSETGYVGLENPQALCYMNSMMTQLFMDLEFRKFIFEANAAGEGGLLNAMKILFATMQSSYGRSVDIRPFAHCVLGTDKKPINVAIQMDTEEFFRLLMDQLESELKAPDDKQRLRNFYGGRSVNQIKSKDCQHVSETTETLFNLPLEVKGKETLEESLKAYVEGESLEGENKYKCEPCGGRLVNAVKRTCLQSVPDNLIVHLKRFDFDPFTLTRSKINDYFRFPARVNMSPYKVEYLSDPEKPMEDDFFELVGILVHAGGVEQGHYWSYIRVRPDNEGSRWIKFNDDTVTEQDLSKVESECFGGNGRHTSAYMLLYQRASSIDKGSASILRAPQSQNPIAQLPRELEKQISEDNERHIREYCMFDQAHAIFVRRMISQMRTINKGICSENHMLEKSVIDMALRHIYNVIARGQDVEELERIRLELRKATVPCVECTKLALDWISNHKHALSDWLIYSYQPDNGNPVGMQMALLVFDALKELRARDPPAYGLDIREADLEQAFEQYRDGALCPLLSKLKDVVDDLDFCPRGIDMIQRPWDMYFRFIWSFADLGVHEVAALLNTGFLQQCLELYHIDTVPEVGNAYPHLKPLLNKKVRPAFTELTTLLGRLLSYVDLEADLVPNDVERLRAFADSDIQKFPFTTTERNLFCRWDKENNCLTVLNRCLETWDMGQRAFAPGDIIRLMLSFEPGAGLLHAIHITIEEGVELLAPALGPAFVMAAVYYCWSCPRPRDAEVMVRDIVNCMTQEKQLLAESFLSFLTNLSTLRNEQWGQKHPEFFYSCLLKTAHLWAIRMLAYEDQEIQSAVLKLTRSLATGNLPQRPAADKELDVEAFDTRIRAVQEMARLGTERMMVMHRELEVPRQYVDCLFHLIIDCQRFLKAAISAYPDSFVNSADTEDLLRSCSLAENVYKMWPESDDYDSSKYYLTDELDQTEYQCI